MGEASALSAMKKGFKDVLSLQHIALVRISKYVKLGSKTQKCYKYFKNSLIIQEQNTKKNHKRVVVLYVIKNHVNLHKL